MTMRFVYCDPVPDGYRFSVDKENGLADVFVYLRRVNGEPVKPECVGEPISRVTVGVDTISPFASIAFNGRVIFEESDYPTFLELYEFGRHPRKVELKANEEVLHRFQVPCHYPSEVTAPEDPVLTAFILPVDHPYAALSRSDGSARLNQLPLGELEFQVFHYARCIKSHDSKSAFVEPTMGLFTITLEPGTTDLGEIELETYARRVRRLRNLR